MFQERTQSATVEMDLNSPSAHPPGASSSRTTLPDAGLALSDPQHASDRPKRARGTRLKELPRHLRCHIGAFLRPIDLAQMAATSKAGVSGNATRMRLDTAYVCIETTELR
jgi:hypothetical protein